MPAANGDRSYAGIARDPALTEGYALLEGGRLDAAATFFRDAAARDRRGEALEAWGMAAWLLHDEQAVFAAREGAYERYLAQGDPLSAGRVAIWLTQDAVTLRGQLALASGWLGRARTLLADLPEAPEHGWLGLMEAEFALMADHDGEAARAHAVRAVAIGRRAGERSVEAYGLAIEGLALVTTGLVTDGMRRLDEAAAACVGGEVAEHFVVASVLCYMMDACDRVRDWDRAREWFEHVTTLAARWGDREFHAQCRPHYAVVLTWRGDWDDAERELQRSIDELTSVAPPMAIEGIVRLAELRWRQGRWDEAAALFEQVRAEPLAQLGRAELALGRGDPREALECVERCLRRLPGSDRIERMPALELAVRAALACDAPERARDALAELDAIATLVATRPARAARHLATGLVCAAASRVDEARRELEDAVDLFDASGAPFETSRARLDLARVLRMLDRGPEAIAQARRALDALGALGAPREAERARLLLRELEAAPATHAAGAAARPAGLSAREVEVLRLLAGGLSNQEIADQLVLSVRTVQRHVDNIYVKTGARGRAAAGAFAASHGLV